MPIRGQADEAQDPRVQPFQAGGFAADNVYDAIIEAQSGGVARRRIIKLVRNGNGVNNWLQHSNGVNSNNSYWLCERNYKLISVKFANIRNGTATIPLITRITAYYQPASSSGNVGTGDTQGWFIQGGDGVSPNELITGYRGRSWFYDAEPEGDVFLSGNVYAFRVTKRDIGSVDVNDINVELTIEES